MKVKPLLQYKVEDKVTPSQLVTLKEEKEEKETKIVEVTNFEDEFTVFN